MSPPEGRHNFCALLDICTASIKCTEVFRTFQAVDKFRHDRRVAMIKYVSRYSKTLDIVEIV